MAAGRRRQRSLICKFRGRGRRPPPSSTPRAQRKCLPHSTGTSHMRKLINGFTITELLVSVAVLVVLVLLVGRLFNSATIVTTSANKRMDADAQLSPLFARMTVDFSQITK